MTRETREEAIKDLKKLKSFHNGSYGASINMAIKALEQEPKTDIRDCKNCKYSKDGYMAGTEKCHECMWESKQEPKTGHWIKSDIGGAKVCSVCQAHIGLSNFKYCPNCGCRMESEG